MCNVHILPKISPSALTVFYDVECFLALQVKAIENPVMTATKNNEYQINYY